MRRRQRSILILFSAAALLTGWTGRPAASATAPAPLKPPRPNIVILHADDLQPDGVAALGNARLHTPNLDRLVGRGTAFVNTYNQGGWHGAICVASRAMMITGRNLWTCGGGDCGDHPLWPTAFGDAGWATFGTGKWHTGRATFERSFEFRGETGPGMLHSTPRGGPAYDRPVPDGEVDTWAADDQSLAGHWMARDDGSIRHSSAHWVDEAIDFIDGHRERADERPFLAYVSFHAPHDPRQAPTEDLERHPLEACDPPPNFVATHPFDQGDARVRDEQLAPFPRTEAAARLHQREYWAIIDHLDAQIGRLLEHLEANDLAEDTLVVFMGDHGLAVGQHGLLGKQNLYEHSAKTPMVFAGPGVPERRRVATPVYLHAAFATIAELAGLDPVAALPSAEAHSLAHLMRADSDRGGAATEPRAATETIYAAYRPDLQRMVRDERFKLILYPKVRVVQLFDLASDPWETRNLAGDPAQRARIERLHAELLRWMDETEDPLDRAALAAPWEWSAPGLRGD